MAVLLSMRLLREVLALSRETMLDLTEGLPNAVGSGVGARVSSEMASVLRSGLWLAMDLELGSEKSSQLVSGWPAG